MHTPGHVGAALLAYAPVAAVLTASGQSGLAALGTATAVGCCTTPDIDRDLRMDHRGLTHTLWFVCLGGVVAGLAGVAFAPGAIWVWGAVLGSAVLLSLGSHVVADSITPMGITPFTPLSDWHHSFDIVPSKHRRANAALLVVGTVAVGVSQAILLS